MPISSLQNPLVKRARKLRSRKFRDVEGAFLIEGIAHVLQALEQRAPLECLLVAPELLTSEAGLMAVQRAGEAGVEVEELGREAFESVMLRDHPSGLGAIARIVERPLTDLAAKEGDVYVGLLDVGNPGNLGSIIRSVDAAGGAGVIIVGDSTDPYHPQSVKASMGTMFSVPIRRTRDLEDLFAWTLMERVGVVATSAKAKLGFWDAAIPTPALFLFGSEAAGLPVEVLERAGLTVTLPMAGTASSLNLSVAVGVFLYEMRRRIAIPSSKSTVTVHLEEGS